MFNNRTEDQVEAVEVTESEQVGTLMAREVG
jgi:hypothetical protein